jgi:hypothetical protein
MEASPPTKRPTSPSWLGSIVVAVTFLFLCLDGYHTEIPLSPKRLGDFFGEPPLINWTHGWPCCVIVRSSIYPLSVGKGGPSVESFTGEAGYYSRWPIDEAPANALNLLALVIDVLAFAALVTGTWFGTALFSCCTAFPPRFSLRTLFLLTTAIAIGLAPLVRFAITRHTVEVGALTIMALAAIATMTALVGTSLHRLGGHLE